MIRYIARIEYVFDYIVDAENEEEVRGMIECGEISDCQIADVYDGPITHAVYEQTT